jgi:predicted enzyme related to lactoylglutathione lyase
LANQFVWVDIPVTDLDRAIAFYSAVLEAPVKREEFPGGVCIGVLPHVGDNVSGCLFISETVQPSAHGPLVYLNCQDRLDAALAAVEPNGGKIIQGKESIGPYGWRALILDSEGNRLALHST